MKLRMSAEYRDLLDSRPRIGRDDPVAHLTYEGTVSVCGRWLDPNYSATNKPACPECGSRV